MLIYMNTCMKLWLTILSRLLTLTARITKDPELATTLAETSWEIHDAQTRKPH